MSQANQHQQMLIRVATALGADLLQQMAFGFQGMTVQSLNDIS
ncbi:hypothetical protein [Endozoicomonas euniceicola]|uniref:Uncharacterized protein n=1 Tax=Endozoicomonas euniceicola TaxID=1234143 RepID=A0ABY6GT29_9GAMM|nr:hypothetical protein [Endozoicomonas euniceicola]UYM15918.1 hypothetical protein NX720_24375 [Endozoicomonas euniceicola]